MPITSLGGRWLWRAAVWLGIGLWGLALSSTAQAQEASVQRVTFPSADARTTLVGYLFLPQAAPASRAAGVVMLHGRGGVYSANAKGHDAENLSLRHKSWGQAWARSGRVALLVDSFGPRGYPQGFPRGSYEDRPAELNEVTVRPLDAYGGLAYLRTRSDVAADRIGLQGWSNGGSAAISAIDSGAPGMTAPTPATGFRAALVFYPACGLKGHFEARPFRPYAPTLVLHGSADEEVSPRRCRDLVERSRAQGGDVTFVLYEGATHSFDSPARSRQKLEANARATDDAMTRALAFFAGRLPP